MSPHPFWLPMESYCLLRDEMKVVAQPIQFCEFDEVVIVITSETVSLSQNPFAEVRRQCFCLDDSSSVFLPQPVLQRDDLFVVSYEKGNVSLQLFFASSGNGDDLQVVSTNPWMFPLPPFRETMS